MPPGQSPDYQVKLLGEGSCFAIWEFLQIWGPVLGSLCKASCFSGPKFSPKEVFHIPICQRNGGGARGLSGDPYCSPWAFSFVPTKPNSTGLVSTTAATTSLTNAASPMLSLGSFAYANVHVP